MGCGAAETAYIDALGHNWEADYYTGANNGTYYKRCTRCSEKTDVRNNPYTITYHANGGKGYDGGPKLYLHCKTEFVIQYISKRLLHI